MERDRLIMTPEEVLKRCDENTIGVVPTLGATLSVVFTLLEAIGFLSGRCWRKQQRLCGVTDCLKWSEAYE